MTHLRASAVVAVTVALSLVAAASQDKPPSGGAAAALSVGCNVVAASGAPPGTAFPAPGTTMHLAGPSTPMAIADRLKADYGFSTAAMAGSASFELAPGAEQRCPGKPGGPFVIVDLVSAEGPYPVVRLRLATASAVLSEATVTLPPSGPILVAAGGDAERYFVLVGRRRMPPPGMLGARGGTPFGGQPAAVLQRLDPVLPEGTPRIENDLLVFLEVAVDAAGEVAALHVVSGPPSLNEPVVAAVRQWKFRRGAPMVSILGLNLRGRDRASAEPPPAPGRADVPPVKVRDVKPRYPAEAQRNRVQGMVIVEVRIDADGTVTDAFAVQPVDGLTQAAVAAVMGWRFAPRPGQGPLRVTVTQNFSLQ